MVNSNVLDKINDKRFNSILYKNVDNVGKPIEPLKYDVYIAGGWFNPNKQKALNMLTQVVDAIGFITYEPKIDSPQISANPTEQEREANFEANLEAIRSSHFVIASTEGLDSGTIWECGYASALGIPVFGFAPLLPKGTPFNLMLAQSMEQVFLSPEAMIDYFIDGIMPPRIGAC